MANKHGCICMLAVFKNHIRRSNDICNVDSILFVVCLMTFQNMQNTFIRQNDIWPYIFPMFENVLILNDAYYAHQITAVFFTLD